MLTEKFVGNWTKLSYEKEAERLQQLWNEVLSEDLACEFSLDVSEYEPDSGSVSSDDSKKETGADTIEQTIEQVIANSTVFIESESESEDEPIGNEVPTLIWILLLEKI